MRFLFCPLASAGYVFPCIAVARVLQAQGHEVAFATGSEFQTVLDEVELRRIPRGETDGASFQVSLWAKPIAVALQFRHVEHALRVFSADALVTTGLTYGPLFAREIFDLPCAVLGFFGYLWPTSDVDETPVSASQALRRWRYGDMLRAFNQSRELFKMPPVEAGPRETPLLGDLYLQRSIGALEDDASAFPDRVHLVGSCLWEPPSVDPELEAWLEEARASDARVLYVNQGRTFDQRAFWGPLCEALEGRRVRLAASTRRMDGSCAAAPPGSFVRPFVPQGRVLPHADAALVSATSTGALGALTHGLPSLVVSNGSEEPEVAERMERSGAALHVRGEDVTTERMAAILDELSAFRALRERAGELKAKFAQVDGPRRAAALLVHLARERRPVLRSAAA